MIKLRVLEILKKKGKTKYWLYNQMNLSYQNFNKRLITKLKASNMTTWNYCARY